MNAHKRVTQYAEQSRVVGESLRRIGVSLRRNLGWLVQFSTTPLDSLDHQSEVFLCEDIHALAFLSGTNAPPDVLARLTMPSKDGPDYERGTYSHAGFPTWFALVRDCQVIALEALTSYVDRGFAPMPKIEVQRVAIRGGEQSVGAAFDTTDYLADVTALARGETVHHDLLKSIRSLFIDRLYVILCDSKERLSRCETDDCRRIYIRTKKSRRYCSTTCRSRDAMKRWRINQKKRKQRTVRKRQVLTKGGKHGTTR